jgi:hypothetical protein
MMRVINQVAEGSQIDLQALLMVLFGPSFNYQEFYESIKDTTI